MPLYIAGVPEVNKRTDGCLTFQSARASKTAKPVRRQKVRCSEMKDDDDFQETKKRNDDERKERKRTDDEQNFAGSSTTSLSDIESHPAHHSEVEIYLGMALSFCMCSVIDHFNN